MTFNGTLKAGQNISSPSYAKVNNDQVIVLPEDLGGPFEGTCLNDPDGFCYHPPSSFKK
jgi:hypothetical protein